MSRNLLKDTRNRTGCNDHRTSGKRLKAPDLFIKMNLDIQILHLLFVPGQEVT